MSAHSSAASTARSETDSTRRPRSSRRGSILSSALSAISNNDDSSRAGSRAGSANNPHFYSQFNDDEFVREWNKNPTVTGRGGVPVPRIHELDDLVGDTGCIRVMCFTWNIDSKSIGSVSPINDLFRKIPAAERPDVFAVALQEIPSTTLRFHRHLINGIQESVRDTHTVFCWVRKWSQMMVILIRKHLSLYTSRPEYQFVPLSPLAKPIKTKGAIGICFRILHASFVFTSCHLSFGDLEKRILDFQKVSASFAFQYTLHPQSKQRQDHSIFNADYLFWFGDLNFRLTDRMNTDTLAENYANFIFVQRSAYEALLECDELQTCMRTGRAFEAFREAKITFPPTYKFIQNSQMYAKHRTPSYTDRILYYSKADKHIQPIRYDTVWPISVSDHKAVYGVYRTKVIDLSRAHAWQKAHTILSTPRTVPSVIEEAEENLPG